MHILQGIAVVIGCMIGLILLGAGCKIAWLLFLTGWDLGEYRGGK